MRNVEREVDRRLANMIFALFVLSTDKLGVFGGRSRSVLEWNVYL